MEVLVVDDSAVVRNVMTLVLTQAGMNVTCASDPIIAMAKMQTLRPDVILLDVEMPRMDGITFLRTLMAKDAIPVVICSSLAEKGSEVALTALREGAVAVMEKPKLNLRSSLEDMGTGVVDTVREAAQARPRARTTAAPRPLDAAPLPFAQTTDQVIAVGASIGGTEAVQFLLEQLPVNMPGMVVVQHMPKAFTPAFARHLNDNSKLLVKEAADGDRIMSGRVLIAPGDMHTMIRRSGAHYIVEVSNGPLVCRHRPSADVLFESAATSAGSNAIGVILTGMGDDGANGLLQMKQRGALTFAQDEASSVVFGMAKEAIRRGAVVESNVMSLQRIPEALVMAVSRKASFQR